jgi:hypothetical protein
MSLPERVYAPFIFRHTSSTAMHEVLSQARCHATKTLLSDALPRRKTAAQIVISGSLLSIC